MMDDADVDEQRRYDYRISAYLDAYHDGEGGAADDYNQYLADDSANPERLYLEAEDEAEHLDSLDRLAKAMENLTAEQKEGTILIGELAKILKGNGVDIGQNRLFERLRQDGFLIKRKGMDYNARPKRRWNWGCLRSHQVFHEMLRGGAWYMKIAVGNSRMEKRWKNQVGAFCRAYPIENAIETFLADIYEPSKMDGRFDYIPADSSAGVVIYEGKFAYSHHATDSVCGKLLNAFDLVRLHKFGELDEKASFKAMADFAVKDERVKKQLAEERRAQ